MFQLYPLYGNHYFVVTVSFVIAMMVVTSFILLKSVQAFFALKSLILYHFFWPFYLHQQFHFVFME